MSKTVEVEKTPVELAAEKYRDAQLALNKLREEQGALRNKVEAMNAVIGHADAACNKAKEALHQAILRAALPTAK